MGDHRGDVEPGGDQHRHGVPGLEHLTAEDALDREHRVDDRSQSNSIAVARREAEQRDLAAVRHRASSIECSAAGAPDISSPTSKPSIMPSSAHHLRQLGGARIDRRSRPPCRRASSSRYSLRSVMTTCRAPACRTTAAAMSPIGPAPVTRTSSPRTGKRQARSAPRCRTDRRWRPRRGPSRRDAARRSSPARRRGRRTRRPGRSRCSRCSGTADDGRRGRMRHRPHTMWPSTLTTSPTSRCRRRCPSSTTLPAISWPRPPGSEPCAAPTRPTPDVDVGTADAGPQDLYQHLSPANGGRGDVKQLQTRTGTRLHQCLHDTHLGPGETSRCGDPGVTACGGRTRSSRPGLVGSPGGARGRPGQRSRPGPPRRPRRPPRPATTARQARPGRRWCRGPPG